MSKKRRVKPINDDDEREEDDEEEEEEEDLNAKRRKILSDLVFNSEALSEDTSNVNITADDDNANFKLMTYNDLRTENFNKNCYACSHMSNDALTENEDYLYLMKIYTDNVGNLNRESIFVLIKNHFDEYCKEHTDSDWTVDEIREHFDLHTKYPTDEINKQIDVYKKIRDNILSSVIYKKGDEIKVNNKNVKDLLAIQREITQLMAMKSKINTMMGYSEILDY